MKELAPGRGQMAAACRRTPDPAPPANVRVFPPLPHTPRRMLPNYPAALHEFWRVLKPGGALVLTAWLAVERVPFFAALRQLARGEAPCLPALLAPQCPACSACMLVVAGCIKRCSSSRLPRSQPDCHPTCHPTSHLPPALQSWTPPRRPPRPHHTTPRASASLLSCWRPWQRLASAACRGTSWTWSFACQLAPGGRHCARCRCRSRQACWVGGGPAEGVRLVWIPLQRSAAAPSCPTTGTHYPLPSSPRPLPGRAGKGAGSRRRARGCPARHAARAPARTAAVWRARLAAGGWLVCLP